MKKDLTGKTIGDLTVLEVHSRSRNGHIRWKCSCSCGGEHNVLSTHLINEKVTHCGCKNYLGGQKCAQWTGCGDISGNVWSAITRARKNSPSRKGLPIDITIEYGWNLFLEQERKCAISGVDLVFRHENGVRVRDYQTASLDRIDSSKGYIEGNVQWVHKDINLMKNRFTDEIFIEWCKTIAKHNDRSIQ